ncbi:baseplate assembly protein [Thauera propionica]|uniref:baseplate assembly protein n=1 Tax=Thauera propionica TaxID=2019431 RepID=UPI0023F45998|nr:baseplate J/gp47 family protein [Thauera propionica]MDD3676887.1 baseplate J/gp47 family protein [Thauera propionica]
MITPSLAPELAGLPPPQVVETLRFETVFDALLRDFQARYPQYSALLASDPAIKLIEVAAYRELLLRARINEAARANLLAFAVGNDLEHLGAFYGVTRLPEEQDEPLRRRIRARIIGFANAGGAAHYRYWALSASPDVADVAVDSPGPGRVRISVLPTGHGDTVPEALLDAVRATVLRDDVRVLTDTVEVVPVSLVPVVVAAQIWLYPDTPMAVFDGLAQRLTQSMAQAAVLGWDLTRSWLIGQLQQPGVHKVELSAPAADIRIHSTQAVRLTDVQLTFAGRDR